MFEKNHDLVQHFSIRKLSVGAASVLIGLTFMQNNQQVKADTVKPNTDTQNTTVVNNQSNQNLNNNSSAQTNQNLNRDVQASASKQVQTSNQNNVHVQPVQKQTISPVSAKTRAMIYMAQLSSQDTQDKSLADNAAQKAIGDKGDVQGDDTVQKQQTVHYRDSATGQDISQSTQHKIDFVPYYKKTTGKISYVDTTTGKTVDTQNLNGYVGGSVTSNPKQLEDLVNNGYKIDSDDSIGAIYKEASANNNYTVKLSHNTISKNGQTVNATQTVKFLDENGNSLYDDNVQNFQFIKPGEITDLVTGQTSTNNNWNTQSKTFDDASAPFINGYIASKGLINGATVTPDKPNASLVIIYHKLGRLIPVVHTDADPDTDAPAKDTPIAGIMPGYYKLDSNDASKLADPQTPPDLDGYVPVNQDITIEDPTKDTYVYYTVDVNHKAGQDTPTKKHTIVTETVNFVDANGTVVYPAKVQSHDFTADEDVEYSPDDQTDYTKYTFATVYAPYVKGYIATVGKIAGDKVTDQSKNTTHTIVYQKLGKFVPVDSSGKSIGDSVEYTLNPNDPSQILPNELPPKIDGYVPEKSAITPVDPTQDTRVIYSKGQASTITINFIDMDSGNTTFDSKVLTGHVGDTANYDVDDDIDNYDKAGYLYSSGNVPTNLEFTKTPLTYEVYFTHGASDEGLDADDVQGDYGDDNGSDDPYDPDDPYGARGPISEFKRIYTNTVKYEGAGTATPKPKVEKSVWTRHYRVDLVTGNKTLIDDWQNNKSNYHGDMTPVIQTYHANKNVTQDIKTDMQNHTETVTYKRNGKMILDFYNQNGVFIKSIEGPYYITDPSDATAIVPNEKVPMYKDYIPSVRNITPRDKEQDEHVRYVHVADKIIVPVPVPIEGVTAYPTRAEVIELAERQIKHPIQHAVIISKTNPVKAGDKVIPYDESTGREIGTQVLDNWTNMEKKQSYYNNAQNGFELDGDGTTEDFADLIKQTKSDTNDQRNTSGKLVSSQREWMNKEVDDHTNGKYNDDFDADASKKIIDDPFKDLNAINHAQKNFDQPKFWKTNHFDDNLDKVAYDTANLDSRNFGNNDQKKGTPIPEYGRNGSSARVASMMLFSLPTNAPVRDLLASKVATVPIAVPADSSNKKALTAKEAKVPSNLFVSLASVNQNVEPTRYYTVVIDGKVVATGLTEDEAKNYVAKYDAPSEINGYHRVDSKDQNNSVKIDSPDNTDTVIYYEKDNTSPSNPDHGSTDNPDNPNHGTSGDHGNTNNPDDPTHGTSGDHGNTDNPDNPNHEISGDHGNTDNQDNPNHGTSGDHGNTDNPDNPNHGTSGDHGNTDNPNNPNHGTSGDHGNTDNPDNPNHGTSGDHGSTDNPNDSTHGTSGDHGNTDNPNNPNHGTSGDHGNTDNPDNPNHGTSGDHGSTDNPDNPNHGTSGDHGSTDNPDNPNHGTSGNHDNTDNPDNPNHGNSGNHGNTDNPDNPNHGTSGNHDNTDNPNHGSTDNPTNPSNPSGPSNPTNPFNPNTPVNPVNPTNPNQPINPNNNGNQNSQNNTNPQNPVNPNNNGQQNANDSANSNGKNDSKQTGKNSNSTSKNQNSSSSLKNKGSHGSSNKNSKSNSVSNLNRRSGNNSAIHTVIGSNRNFGAGYDYANGGYNGIRYTSTGNSSANNGYISANYDSANINGSNYVGNAGVYGENYNSDYATNNNVADTISANSVSANGEAQLPQTGSKENPALVALGLAIIATTSVFQLAQRRKLI